MYPLITVKFTQDYYDDEKYKIHGARILLKGKKYLKNEVSKFKSSKAYELVRSGVALIVEEE